MHDPFRHDDGVPVLALPVDPPAPQISARDVLEGKSGNTSVTDGANFRSQLLFYSASISVSTRGGQSAIPAHFAGIFLPAISTRPNFSEYQVRDLGILDSRIKYVQADR